MLLRNMAMCQVENIWLVLAVLSLASTLSQCCHPTSKKLHICLNIYLERDFIHVETIAKGQDSPSDVSGGRVFLEGPELQSICGHISSLLDCYEDLLGECDTYWKLNRYTRVMSLMNKIQDYLCRNSTDNLRDLLLNGACLRNAQNQTSSCSSHGFQWTTTWKEVLRLQVDSADRCPALDYYTTCLIDKLKTYACGQEASAAYGRLFNVWLNEWCNKESQMDYFYLPVLEKWLRSSLVS